MDANLSPLFLLRDEEEARRFGQRLGLSLRAGFPVLLDGPVGAGKSHIARAAIRARTGEGTEVPSPTFTLVQTYEAEGLEIWHADLYRLTHPSEADELGLIEAMAEAITLIEWPDRLGSDLPKAALRLSLSHAGDARHLRIAGAGPELLAALTEGLSHVA